MPNYLGSPKFADYDALRRYCRQKDAIRRFDRQLRQGYDDYSAYFGRPFRAWQFAQSLPADAAQRMKSLYRSDLKVVGLIKRRLSQRQGLNSCPYCGLQKNVTADHYLPKEHFPQYAVFSRNLVPSCSDCQSPAGKHHWFPGFTTDETPPQRRPSGRLLHPYFDEFLRRRVLRIDFQPAEVLTEHSLKAALNKLGELSHVD
ncbi:HNH endonuclease [Cupriavidus necator]